MRSGRTLAECLNDIVWWGDKLARHIDGMDEQAFLATLLADGDGGAEPDRKD